MTKKSVKTIIYMAMLPAIMSVLSSCVYDKYEDPGITTEYTGSPHVVLKISSLGNVAANSYYHNEKVKSVRVIMLSGDTLQVNEKYTFSNLPAENFSQLYTYRTTPFTKDFFIIANEESVGNFTYKGASGSEMEGRNLGALLDGFAAETETKVNGTAIRALLNSIYFKPEFPENGNENVFLTYSSYYSGIDVSAESDYLAHPLEMFLVPVATKFYFKFTNNRPNDVELSKIEIGDFDDLNFLMARLDEEELTKEFEGEKLYWIDWLARISEMSHLYPNYSGNLNFNYKYGWINGYSMPQKSKSAARNFISEKLTIAAAKTEEDKNEENGYRVVEPGILQLGPYYMPESWNEYTYYDTFLQNQVTIQQYTLSLGVHDVKTETSKDPVFVNTPIDNVKALFRNTYVIIEVVMNAGKLEIYAEIADWKKHHSQGYVVDQ